MRSWPEYERRPYAAMFLVLFIFLGGLLAFAKPADAQARVIPTLDCIEVETRMIEDSDSPNTFVTAHLGYASEFTTPVEIPHGSDNFFSPGAPVRGQPTTFQTGRNDRVFEVTFNQTRIRTLTWFLSARSVPGGGSGGTNLRITDDLNVYCAGQSPPVVLDPESLDFGETLVGRVSEIKLLTVQNMTARDLRVDQADIIGPDVSSFRKTGDECSGEVLAFGESCELRARFVPRDEGPASATLRITSNAFDSPARVSLSGTGTVAAAPAVESIDPEQGARGETVDLTIEGSNFRDGATATLAGEVRLRASSVGLEPSGDLTATFSIPSSMPLGTYDLEVRNPDGQEASLEDAFEVTGGGGDGDGGGNGDGGDGNEGGDGVDPAEPGPSTTTLNASARWINFGQSATLSGRLADESGGALSSKRVILERRFVNQRSFQRIGMRTTNPNGRFSARVNAPRNAVFRARFTGDEENRSSQRAVRVNVRAAVGLNLSRDSALPGQNVVIAGNVRPVKSSFVSLTVRRGGEVVLNRRVNLNDRSRYRFVYRVPLVARGGNYVVQVRFPGDRQNLAGATSQRLQVTTPQTLRDRLLNR